MSSQALYVTDKKAILELDVAPISYLDNKMGDYMIHNAVFISNDANPIITSGLFGEALFKWLRENNFKTATKEERCLYELAK